MLKKSIILFIVMVFLAVPFAFSGGQGEEADEEVVTIDFWFPSANETNDAYFNSMGPKFMESQRALLRAAGATPVDPEPGGEDGYCCGIAAGCSRYDPRDILKTSALAHRALRSTGAKETAVYCGGCLLTLCLSRIAVPGAPPVIHSLQYVRMAAGENPPLAQTSRALRIALGIGRNAFPALLSGRRFFLGGSGERSGRKCRDYQQDSVCEAHGCTSGWCLFDVDRKFAAWRPAGNTRHVFP